jgi:putative transposase
MSTMCRGLEVSESGFYAWLRCAPSRRSQANTVLGERIVRIYQENRGCLWQSAHSCSRCRAEGRRCGRKRVARLMREHGLSAKARLHRTRTTASQHEQPVAPNLLNRDFTASAPNTRVGGRYHWGMDMGGLALSRGGA